MPGAHLFAGLVVGVALAAGGPRPTEAVHDGAGAAGQAPSLKDSAVGIVILACVAFAGPWLGRRARMPAAALAGPMVLGVVLGWAGAFHDAPVPSGVTAVALAVIGLEIGLRFDRSTLRSLGRMAPVAGGLTAAVMLACALLGEILSLLTGISPVDGYLMTTPGGINAVLGAAVSMSGINVALVAVAQILRLLTMILFVPALVRRLTRTPGPMAWVRRATRRPRSGVGSAYHARRVISVRPVTEARSAHPRAARPARGSVERARSPGR